MAKCHISIEREIGHANLIYIILNQLIASKARLETRLFMGPMFLQPSLFDKHLTPCEHAVDQLGCVRPKLKMLSLPLFVSYLLLHLLLRQSL